jgi:hypothetical protein
MTRRPPRLPLSLVARVVPDSEPLMGDLLEEFAHGRSRAWVWWQCAIALAGAAFRGDAEIRPLHLVDLQPMDAIERTMAVHRRRREVTPTPSPFSGGIGLVVLGGLVTAVAPVIWLALLMTSTAGVGLAVILARWHDGRRPTRPARIIT